MQLIKQLGNPFQRTNVSLLKCGLEGLAEKNNTTALSSI